MPSLPVSNDYLACALEDGREIDDMILRHRNVGELLLPTGRLIACDPFLVTDETPPFRCSLPSGKFAVLLSIANIKTDQRVAFATIRFTKTTPTSWEMLTTGNHDPATLKEGHILGYAVDSGTACFMDVAAARALSQRMSETQDYFEVLIEEMQKTYVHTWDWLNKNFGDGNLIAFSSGGGDGVYATYAGRDSNGQLSAIVTDFDVVPSPEPQGPFA